MTTKRADPYDRFLTFRDASEDEIDRWKASLARFVHIRRDPFTVLPVGNEDDRILSVYREMYEVYFDQSPLIPAGRFVEGIYSGLGLPSFDTARPRLEGYLGSIAGYRKNQHPDLPGVERQREWGRWGYDRTNL